MKNNRENKLVEFLFTVPGICLCFLIISPIAIFSFQIADIDLPSFEFVAPFLWTVLISILSTIFTIIFALMGVRGLIAFCEKKYYFYLESLILLPGLIPPLIMSVSFVNFVEIFFPFPFGFWSLIVIQVMIFVGIVSVAFARSLFKESYFLNEYALVANASPFLFLKTCCKSILIKDIKNLGILIFSGAFVSLSIPLLIAGDSIYSLEFYIYERLKYPEFWPSAFTLILFQILFIFYVCSFRDKKALLDSPYIFKIPSLIANKFYIIVLIIPFIFSLGGLFIIPSKGVFEKFLNMMPELIQGSLYSLLIGFAVGFLNILFFIFVALGYKNKKIRDFIYSYLGVNLTLLALAFLILPLPIPGAVYIKWVLGLAILFFPTLYRFRGEIYLEKINYQYLVARSMGANSYFIFKYLIWPQCCKIFFLCAGISAFWASGDFAYSLMISGGKKSLSLIVKDLFSSHRIDLALLNSWILLLLGLFMMLVFLLLGVFFDKKPVLYSR